MNAQLHVASKKGLFILDRQAKGLVQETEVEALRPESGRARDS